MKFNFLQKQTSRREMLRGSATLAGGAFLAHLFPARLVRASAAGYRQPAPSPAALLASMRAKFNAVPMETQKLADNVTKFSRPFLQDIFSRWAAPNRPLDASQDPIGHAPRRYGGGFFVSPNAKEESQAMPNANVHPEKTIDSS